MRNVNPRIIIETRGGLGNQMFQVALGMNLARLKECPLQIDARWHAAHPDRPFQLDEILPPSVNLSKSAGPFSGLFARHEIRRRIASRVEPFARKLYIESELSFDPDVMSSPAGTRIVGYFQSWKYFSEINSDVVSRFSTVASPSAWFRRMRSELLSGGPFVAVHVRRGDYTSRAAQAVHGLLSSSYYESALIQHQKLKGETRIVVFSDDVSAARGLLPFLPQDTLWIEPPPESVSRESMILMSEASGLVIANSSFSWWAAWLKDSPGREVFAPKRWAVDGSQTGQDLIPGHWRVLS